MVRIGPRAKSSYYIKSLGNCYHQHSIYMLSKQSTSTILILRLFHTGWHETQGESAHLNTQCNREFWQYNLYSRKTCHVKRNGPRVYFMPIIIDGLAKQYWLILMSNRPAVWTKWWGCPALLISLYISHGHGHLLCTVTR